MSWMTPFPGLNQRRGQCFELDHGRYLPMLTVDALPADCSPLKIKRTAKFGEKLRPIFATMYVRKENMYIGRRPTVSDSDPQNSGDIPWITRYEVIVSETVLRLTFRSCRVSARESTFGGRGHFTVAIASRAGK